MSYLLSLFFVSLLNAQDNDEFSVSKVSINGYGEFHINSINKAKEPTKTTADFHRFVLFVGYNFNESWSLKSEFELEHNFVADGDGELELEQAYVDYHSSDEFGFRAGVILAPVGYINTIHEPPTFFGVERPTFATSILPTTWFDNGFSVYGLLNRQLAYNVSLLGGLDGDAIAEKGIRSGRTKGYKGELGGYNFNNPTLIGRIDYVSYEGLNIGLSYTMANARRDSLVSIKTSILDIHTKYQMDNIYLKLQYAQVNYSNLSYAGHSGILFEFGYDLLADDHLLAPFFRFESLNMKRAAIDEESNHQDILTFGVSYKPIPQLVFKTDYMTSKTKNSGAESDNTISLGMGYMF